MAACSGHLECAHPVPHPDFESQQITSTVRPYLGKPGQPFPANVVGSGPKLNMYLLRKVSYADDESHAHCFLNGGRMVLARTQFCGVCKSSMRSAPPRIPSLSGLLDPEPQSPISGSGEVESVPQAWGNLGVSHRESAKGPVPAGSGGKPVCHLWGVLVNVLNYGLLT